MQIHNVVKKVRNLPELFCKLSMWILLGLSIILTGISLITLANQEERLVDTINPILILLPSVFLFSFLLYIVCFKMRLLFNNRLFLFFSLFIIFVVQLIIVFGVARISPITDCYTTLDEAIAMCQQNQKLDNYSEYFARYSNNYFFTIIMYYFFLGAKFLGIPYFLFAVVLNVLVIDIAIYIGYLIVKSAFSVERANIYLFLSVLCPTNYVFVYFPYTNTFSMPFILGIILAGIKKGTKGKIAFVVLSVLGTFIRPTTIFATIGVLIYWIVKNKTNVIDKRKIIRQIGLIVLAICVTFSVKFFVNSHLANPNNEKSFPVTHWVMVGLQGTGEITDKDVKFTQSYDTKEEKISANIEEIKKRVKKIGISGVIKLYAIKIGKIWSIGTDDFQNLNTSDMRYSKAYELIFGNDNTWLIIYCQIFRSASFLFMIFMLIQMIRDRKIDSRIVFTITMLGIIVFLMIWETNKKHSICYTPVMMIMMQCGIHDVISYKEKLVNKEKMNRVINRVFSIGAVLSLLIVIGILVAKKPFDVKQSLNGNRVLYKNEFRMKEISIQNLSNQQITQSIVLPKNFNEIEVHIKKNSDGMGNGILKLQLYNQNLELVKEELITSENLEDTAWITMNNLNCNAGKYTIMVKGEGDCSFANLICFAGKELEHYNESNINIGNRVLGISSMSIRAYR